MGRWLEARRLRRKRRQRGEEILGWIVVPLISALVLWAGFEMKDRVAAGLSIALGLSR
jgi:hypothetical protein